MERAGDYFQNTLVLESQWMKHRSKSIFESFGFAMTYEVLCVTMFKLEAIL